MKFFIKKQPNMPRRRQAELRREHEVKANERASGPLFRRNRTLTGSSSVHVASPSEGLADMKSSRVHVHELRRKRRHIGLLLVGVMATGFILATIVSEFTARASVVSKEPAQLIVADYEQAIQKYLQDHPLERLRFILDEVRLSSHMQAAFPEVHVVRQIGWDGFGVTQFELQMRQPVVAWAINDRQQYVDESGVAFTRNYYPSPALHVSDQSGSQLQAGATVASTRFLSFVGRVAGVAKQQGATITDITIPAGTTRQIVLTISGVGYPIKLSIDRPAGEQVEDMMRAVRWFQANGITPQYVDVRVSGKAYYK
jgi:hypothetical protein